MPTNLRSIEIKTSERKAIDRLLEFVHIEFERLSPAGQQVFLSPLHVNGDRMLEECLGS